MNSRSARPLSLEFISSRVQLLPREIAAGYRMGFLDDRTVVKLAEREISAGSSTIPAVEELALLLSDDIDRVPTLVSQVESSTEATGEEPWRVWLFLTLAWIHENQDPSGDPMGDIEAVYAEFDYPEEMEGFVPFLPAPSGQASGREAIQERWRAYLDQRAHEYAQRRNRHP